ncbi:hypothetical protein [Alloyangia pacifica]|uniref:hypothetical protein n=1 Tax=Alloyangia pacifica TaxID=311180 RepID=UPI0031DAAF7F
MPPFEIGNALRNGIVDIANTTAVFHASLVPEGVAMTLATQPDVGAARERRLRADESVARGQSPGFH